MSLHYTRDGCMRSNIRQYAQAVVGRVDALLTLEVWSFAHKRLFTIEIVNLGY